MFWQELPAVPPPINLVILLPRLIYTYVVRGAIRRTQQNKIRPENQPENLSTQESEHATRKIADAFFKAKRAELDREVTTQMFCAVTTQKNFRQ